MGMMHLGFAVVNPTTIAFAAVLGMGGLVLAVLGFFDLIPGFGEDSAEGSEESSGSDTGKELAVRVAWAAGGGILGFVGTGWPVMAFFLAIGGFYIPTLSGAKAARRAEIEKVEAMATWIESVRDNIAGSAGLTQALRQSADNAPQIIRGPIRDMALRLQHQSIQLALKKLAAELANPSSDLVVACLVLATTRSAGGLGTALAQTAQTARDSATMMRQIEASRAASASQARVTAIITAAMAAGLILFKRDFVEPYNSFGGQIALFIIMSLAAGTVVMLQNMSKPNVPERVFKPEDDLEELAEVPVTEAV